MQCCGTRNTNGGSRSASPARTVRTVRDVPRIRTYSTPETRSTHVPCNPALICRTEARVNSRLPPTPPRPAPPPSA
eukprot:285201-Chlamydomonas_euryale.AAC.1